MQIATPNENHLGPEDITRYHPDQEIFKKIRYRVIPSLALLIASECLAVRAGNHCVIYLLPNIFHSLLPHLNFIKSFMDICLMGLSKVGKTSIAKVIFQKMNPKLTLMLEETTKLESF